MTRDDIPLSYEAITDAWLSAVLCRDHSEAQVVDHWLGPADEGNTSRRRIHLAYNRAGEACRLPDSVFCKSSHRLDSRMVGAVGTLECEVGFYRHVRDHLDLEAPRALWARIDPESLNSIVVLQDLGEDTTFCSVDTAMTDADFFGQASLLASYHRRFLGSEDFEPVLGGFLTWPQYFARALELGIAPLCQNGFREAEAVIPARLFARADEIWPATLASVARHDDLPATLVHCDTHLRNWYRTADGRMGLSDWKAWRGHWSRDLAYAVATSLDVGTRRRLEGDILRSYLDALGASDTGGQAHAEAWTNYRQQLLGVLAWWTITLAPSSAMPDMQPREIALEMIRRIAIAIDDLDALDSFAA
jgi:hypothetical protein